MGFYRGVKQKPRRQSMAEREREMRESNRGKVQGRRWLKREGK